MKNLIGIFILIFCLNSCSGISSGDIGLAIVQELVMSDTNKKVENDN